MAGTKKQQQVAKLLQEALDSAFRKNGIYNLSPGLISIHEVTLSPDLLDSKVYLSLFQVDNPEAFWQELHLRSGDIKNDVGRYLRHKLRRIPVITYLEDETVEQAFKIDQIIRDLNIPPAPSSDEEE